MTNTSDSAKARTTSKEKAVSAPADDAADVKADDKPLSVDEQASLATLTKEQPPNAVSEVVTGTPERPESTRIVAPGEVPVSAGETRPAEFRDESQVAPAQVEGESPLHGNADY